MSKKKKMLFIVVSILTITTIPTIVIYSMSHSYSTSSVESDLMWRNQEADKEKSKLINEHITKSNEKQEKKSTSGVNEITDNE